jgi:hypothetical protein
MRPHIHPIDHDLAHSPGNEINAVQVGIYNGVPVVVRLGFSGR